MPRILVRVWFWQVEYSLSPYFNLLILQYFAGIYIVINLKIVYKIDKVLFIS